jgi:HAD superfamily hydrolase (TIGR01484 family)
MRYQALATDYDGTLAADGHVNTPTIQALQDLHASGRRLILVTGRELPEILQLFPKITLFEWVVAENGALLYETQTKAEKLLVPPPPERFVETLRSREVKPVSMGRVIVATRQPNEKVVLEVIRDLGLELQVIFNKGAVMILPSGVNKAIGLQAALKEMSVPVESVVGVGDAENDHAFLKLCGFSAAVSNALPALKETADLVTTGDHGAGVTELIRAILADDLRQASLHRRSAIPQRS